MRCFAGFAALFLAGSLHAQVSVNWSGVRAGAVVDPDTVRVGQPATLTMRVQVPVGTRVTFPQAVDSTSAVEPLDPVSVREEARGDVIELTATYRFLAWELGDIVIPIGAARLEREGSVKELTFGDPTVYVATVLPADTTQRVPKPAKDIAVLPVMHWDRWLMIAGVLVVAILIGWLLQRRSKRPPPAIEPFAEAQRAFGRLSALDLIGAGEPAKHVGASVEVLRRFLATRAQPAAMGLTSAELIRILRADAAVPTPRVATLLTGADAVKFAPNDVDAPTAEALGAEASAIVTEVHRHDMHQGKRK